MGEMIQKPDTNPLLILFANWLGFGGFGYYLMGQQKKAIISWIAFVVGGTLTCGVGYLLAFVTAYDGYLLAQKLESGQAIGENENSLDFLNAIFKD